MGELKKTVITSEQLYSIAQELNYMAGRNQAEKNKNKALAYCIYTYIIENYQNSKEYKYSLTQKENILSGLSNIKDIIDESIHDEANKLINNQEEFGKYLTENKYNNIAKDYNSKSSFDEQIEVTEAQHLWDWGEILFLVIIIFSLGILTPVAFLTRRIYRGFSIIVNDFESKESNKE